MDIRVKRNADIGSVHQLLVAAMRLKITAFYKPEEKIGKKIYVTKVHADNIKNGFVAELNSQLSSNQGSSIEQKLSSIKNAFLTASENFLGLRPAKRSTL